MIELLSKIPINIWSVALGSIIALVGVLISNRSHIKRLKIQLEHDAELKAIERKTAMRREVYLNSAEELVRASSYLGSLSQIDLAKTNIADGFQDFFASSAKLMLVAEEETGKAVNELVIAYTGLLFKLMIDVMPISEQRNQIDIINEHYNDTQTEIKRILAEMSRQNESGSPDERIFKALDSSIKFQQKRAKELTDERNGCWKKINEYTKKFALKIMDEMQAITILQAPAMVSIRKELDIDTNIESYRELIDSSTERVKKQLDNLLDSLRDTA